jgi:photosystem II stability/assembly factor-like uncharacterized protein
MAHSTADLRRPATGRHQIRAWAVLPALLLAALTVALPASASASVWTEVDGWTYQGLCTTTGSDPLPDLYDVTFCDVTHGWAVGTLPGALDDTAAIVATVDGGDTWTAQDPGTDEPLASVDCTDAAHAWAVGDHGVILATTDGGATWDRQVSGTSESLKAVDFADAAVGWAVGGDERDGDGVILATTDGGATWVKQTSVPAADLMGVSFSDAEHGWAVGWYVTGPDAYDKGVILATSDGGATWQTQYEEGWFLCDVSSSSVTHAWVANSGSVIATGDGGATWHTSILPDPPGGDVSYDSAAATAFPDDLHGWVVGGMGQESQGDVVLGAMILATSDGGVTWQDQSVYGPTADGANSVAFPDATHGWVVGPSGGIWATSDGGQPLLTLVLTGFKGHVVKLGKRVKVNGAVPAGSPAGTSVALIVQRRHGHAWKTVKRATRLVSDSGSFSWRYRPVKRGAYRLRAHLVATAPQKQTTTSWVRVRVR